jgi:uncharacterized protein (DUF4415 family)
MPKLKSGSIVSSNEENKEIIRQGIEDGTLFTDEQLGQMKPISEFPTLQFPVKPGSQLKKNPKRQLTIRLDGEIIDFFKAY